MKTQQELNLNFTNKHWIFEDNLRLTTSTFRGCTTGGSVDSNRGGGGDSHGGGDDGVGRMKQLKASNRVELNSRKLLLHQMQQDVTMVVNTH